MRVAVLVSLLAACVSTQATHLAGYDPKRPPSCPDSVRVYASASGIGAEYIELALLHASGAEFATQDQMVQSLRKKAAEVGATGLILKGFTEAGYRQFQGAEATAIWLARDSLATKPCPAEAADTASRSQCLVRTAAGTCR